MAQAHLIIPPHDVKDISELSAGKLNSNTAINCSILLTLKSFTDRVDFGYISCYFQCKYGSDFGGGVLIWNGDRDFTLFVGVTGTSYFSIAYIIVECVLLSNVNPVFLSYTGDDYAPSVIMP